MRRMLVAMAIFAMTAFSIVSKLPVKSVKAFLALAKHGHFYLKILIS
jgi:hypothetical protein